jgi:hypothetical protein
VVARSSDVVARSREGAIVVRSGGGISDRGKGSW